MSYKFRFSHILEDLKDNPLVPADFKSRLDTLWLLDLAGNDTEFSESEQEFIIDLANSYLLPPNRQSLYSQVQSKAFCKGLPVKVTKRRY